MSGLPVNLSAFTDAAADRVARSIAAMQRDAARERELRDAQFAARMAAIETRLASVAELERKLADRLAAVKDGEPGINVDMDAVERLVSERVEQIVSSWGIDALVDRAVAALPPAEPGKSVTVDDVAPMIADRIAEAIAALPPVEPKEVDPELVRELIGEAVSAIPPVEPREVDPEVIARMVADEVGKLPPAEPGKSVDPETVRAMVDEAVAALPTPEKGKDADPELIASLVAGRVREAVEALPPAKQGDPGPMGALPVVKAWEDRVYYEGEVCEKDGSLFQARKDTGKEPDHEDWSCIVRKGKDGDDGRSFTIRGTWVVDGEYRELDVVALNGASFAARRDDPGACPGEGWQLMSTQGKPGKQGERGPKGDTGHVRAVTAMRADNDGLLTLVNADGSTVECDLYPVLSRLG